MMGPSLPGLWYVATPSSIFEWERSMAGSIGKVLEILVTPGGKLHRYQGACVLAVLHTSTAFCLCAQQASAALAPGTNTPCHFGRRLEFNHPPKVPLSKFPLFTGVDTQSD